MASRFSGASRRASRRHLLSAGARLLALAPWTRTGAALTAATAGALGVASCATPVLPWSAPAPDLAVSPTAGPAPTATPRAGPTGMTLTSFAPGIGGRLLFVADANVWLLERGQLRPVTTDRVSRQPSWSRDGQRIAVIKLWTSGSDVWALDADGRNGQELTDFTYREDARQNYALQPIWSMDGSRLYFLSQEGSEDTQLWQIEVAGRRRLRFLSHGDRFGGIDHPRLSLDGRMLAVSSYQPGRGPQGRPQIWTYALPNGPWRQLTERAGGAYDPDWSPDGRLAFVTRAPDAGLSTGRHDVWVMRADGTNQHAVTTSGLNRSPSWSPDGAWLSYLSARSGTFDVWLVAAPVETTTATGTPTPAPSQLARQITSGGSIDAASGLAWSR